MDEPERKQDAPEATAQPQTGAAEAEAQSVPSEPAATASAVSAPSVSAPAPSDPLLAAASAASPPAVSEPQGATPPAASEAAAAAPASVEPGPALPAVAAPALGEADATGGEPAEPAASRTPTILFLVALVLVGGSVLLATLQKTVRSGLFVVQARASPPGTVEKYGQEPEMWLIFPELRTEWSCRLHGGVWKAQTWSDAAGKQNTRAMCKVD